MKKSNIEELETDFEISQEGDLIVFKFHSNKTTSFVDEFTLDKFSVFALAVMLVSQSDLLNMDPHKLVDQIEKNHYTIDKTPPKEYGDMN